MSAETGRLLPTEAPSFWVSSSLSSRRPASTTVKPDLINASDAARPTPVPAPVTIAIFSAASAMLFFPVVDCSDFHPHFVMPGLDPGIHPSSEDSCEGDGLPVKPGNDGGDLCITVG